jgi:4-diphosphocytidyl-2-C-methyl-D-erythritol kinase
VLTKLLLNSYAKLNLYLEVLKARPDKYHNIKTIFERIDLYDRIVLKARPDKKINLTCKSSRVPGGRRNLAYRSAKLLQDTFHIDQGADIKIVKRIPVAAGLGGGSSNAASVLVGLDKLWGLNLGRNKLLPLARKIGSDVPFFIYQCPFARGTERGDRIKPLKALNHLRLWHILVVPKVKVLTPHVYKRWDSLNKIKGPRLTRVKDNVKIVTLALRRKDLSLLGCALFNSLEQVTTSFYPKIRRIKDRLSQMGVKSILMSGSGPAIFGVVSSRKEALSLYRQLKGNSYFGEVFITRTQ